ncbi:hypothetical protein NQ314_017257 [Rhamnusium bicolor]|uniref:DUF4371 domain-containing protein n=1 Tax=Rhamnusium bicolor TaxID=1586634 RepID=A0AAV8WTT6_9CUCU|nr:hypothetical protein NQ314_017257 [Rhamnusium bicolor]
MRIFFAGEQFLVIYQKPELDIRNQLSDERKKQVLENRARLIPILKTIILHGQQNIPLRGYRDDGPLIKDSGEFNLIAGDNDGCFRALLRFRRDAGDTVLKHLKNSAANATYISKTTANQLINCCEKAILSVITKQIDDSGYYSIIFDETTDVATISQLSVSIRYVYKEKVLENFVGFLDLHKSNYDSETNEKVLGQTVIKKLKSLGLNLEKCVGIGCDGCSVNLSQAKGAAVTIQKEAKNANVFPCFNHALNLSISKSLSQKC